MGRILFACMIIATTAFACGQTRGARSPATDDPSVQVPTTVPPAVVSSGGTTIESSAHRARVIVGGPQPLAQAESSTHKITVGPMLATD
jgi:hypothetical protein